MLLCKPLGVVEIMIVEKYIRSLSIALRTGPALLTIKSRLIWPSVYSNLPIVGVVRKVEIQGQIRWISIACGGENAKV